MVGGNPEKTFKKRRDGGQGKTFIFEIGGAFGAGSFFPIFFYRGAFFLWGGAVLYLGNINQTFLNYKRGFIILIWGGQVSPQGWG